jgi:hypothetical protein
LVRDFSPFQLLSLTVLVIQLINVNSGDSSSQGKRGSWDSFFNRPGSHALSQQTHEVEDWDRVFGTNISSSYFIASGTHTLPPIVTFNVFNHIESQHLAHYYAGVQNVTAQAVSSTSPAQEEPTRT